MRRNTIEKILLAMNLSSKDETRPSLQAVCISKCKEDNQKFLIQSTSGYAMFKEYVIDDQLKFTGFVNEDQFLIANTRANINDLKETLKDKLADFFPHALKNLEERHNDFPRTDQFHPLEDSKCFEVGISMRNLQAVIKSMGKSKEVADDQLVFKFKKGKNGNTSIIYIQSLNERGTENFRNIMPLRIS